MQVKTQPKSKTSSYARLAQEDPTWVRWILTSIALLVVFVLVVIPVANVFSEALAGGLGVYWDSLFADEDTRHSILLTLTVVPFALVANVVFGVAAAWAITRFHFPGRALLTALIDLPFSVSPVVAGLMFVLIFRAARVLRGIPAARRLRHHAVRDGRRHRAVVGVGIRGAAAQ